MKTKKLVIVESPHKAHTIQSFLGDDYIVKSTKGHILELASGGKYGMGVDIKNNFEPKYLIMEDKINMLQELMDLAKNSKEVILASDNDREGLAIARHIYDRLKDYNNTFKRVVFSEITKKEVLKAIDNYEDINSKNNTQIYYSQTARRVLDRIVGFTASPFLMQYFGPNLSAGRVQSVVVRMITDREEEIQTFIPEEYFTIQAKFSKDDQQFIAKYDAKITNKAIADKIKSELEQKNNEYIIASVEANEEKKKPFPPLITSKLQQIMSKQYKINSTRTMAAAQSLYEAGFITYMRTDSVRISDDAIKSVRAWLKENNHDIPKTANIFKNKNTSQDAHEAIRPTDVSNMPDSMNLIGDEKQVYEVIWKYFAASQMRPAIYNTLKVNVEVKNTEHTLTASGKALKYPGFLSMLGEVDNSSIDIPNLIVNDVVILFGDKPITLERKQTQPPPRYSEASLIKSLEEKEIGRPSTYATLISTITNRKYVAQDNNIFYPTELGKKITAELTKWFSFLEYNYTAKLEMELDKIAEGSLDYIKMLNDFYSTFKEELNKAYINKGSKPCSKCDGMMRELTNKKGQKFYGCGNYPRCKNTESIPNVKNVA